MKSRAGEHHHLSHVVSLLDSLLVLFLMAPSAHSWLASKCSVFEDRDYWFSEVDCHGEKLIAKCSRVTDIRQDLQGLPSNLLNLCIKMDAYAPAVPLAAGSFSQFVSLEFLSIHGCFSQIQAGAFQGLSNLTGLQLTSHSTGSSEGCCEAALGASVFHHLTALKTLDIALYKVSNAALEVFDGIPELEKFWINVCMEDWSEVICRLTRLTLVHEFILKAYNVGILKHPDCTNWNIPAGERSLLRNLRNPSLDFHRIEKIEQGVLKYFGDLTHLTLEPWPGVSLMMYLALFGISKINNLSIKGHRLDLGELCQLSETYSTEIIAVDFEIIDTTTVVAVSCDSLKSMYFYSLGNVFNHYLHMNTFLSFTNLSTLGVMAFLLDPLDFRSICLSSPQSVRHLSSLALSKSNLTKLVNDQFLCFVSLETVELSCDRISEIEELAFRGLGQLQVLDLQGNNIWHIRRLTFSGLYALTYLDLQANPISQIETRSFEHLTNLQQFLLGDLNPPPLEANIRLNLTDLFGEIPRGLGYLFISSGLRPMRLVFGTGGETLNRSLSLHIKGQRVTVENCEGSLLKSVVTLRIDSGQVLCGAEFIGRYTRRVEQLRFTSVFPEDVGDIVVINQLVHLRKLSLENIDLSRQPNVAVMFHNLTRLEILALTNCRIDFLDGSLTKDLKSLRGLHLILRDTVKVFSSFVENLFSLRYLHFWNLRIHCSCDNAWLISWAQNSKLVEVHVHDPSIKEMECLAKNGIDHLKFVQYTKDDCSFEVEFVLFAFTSLSVVTFMLAVLFHRFAGPYILPLYHIVQGWFQETLRKDGERRYRHDAFVSYSGRDERWVVEKLLPNLERRGPPFLRLCLHTRDFQLGQDIVENITESLYGSRRTLCLVSRNYLRSNWCSLELQLATCRLQVEHRDILILVFLEKIPSKMLSAHHRLARLVKTRTYLAWPQEDELQGEFWDRMWHKLRPKTGN
ncbi:uncharacterized protein [Salminus brasiliensis]|uniref:uncharacterized protein n=1 Tax=Salminus brasiliensis TaxID=930266 RepID=UPI003B82E3EC